MDRGFAERLHSDTEGEFNKEAAMVDEALVERLAKAFYEAENLAMFGPSSKENPKVDFDSEFPRGIKDEYRSVVRAVLAELTKEYAIVPKAEYERLRTVAALALSQPTGLDYGNPRKDGKEVRHV